MYYTTAYRSWKQCCGSRSGSIRSVIFWTSRIRIRHFLYRSGSGSSSSKKSKKNLDFYCFVTSLRLFIFEDRCKCAFKYYGDKKKTYFLLGSWKQLTKRAGPRSGFGSGSVTLHRLKTSLVTLSLFWDVSQETGQVLLSRRSYIINLPRDWRGWETDSTESNQNHWRDNSISPVYPSQ